MEEVKGRAVYVEEVEGEGESGVCGGSAGVKGRAVYVEEVEGEGESGVCGGSGR